MDHGQLQRGISLPFPDWWQDADLAIPDFEERSVRLTIVVSHINEMPLLDRDITHLVANCVITITCPAVDTGPKQEVRTEFMRQAEEFVDVAFPIADMDTSAGTAEQLRRLR
jgi:hypothetical protein